MQHEAANERQSQPATFYDTIRRINSFTSENAVDPDDTQLVYNALYATSPAGYEHARESGDYSVPGDPIKTNHGVHNAEDADQFHSTLAPSISVTNDEVDTVHDNESEHSSIYNYPACIIPTLLDSDSLRQEMLPAISQFAAHINDGVTTNTTDCAVILMTHNNAYDVGSAGSSPPDLQQQLSIDASPMGSVLQLVVTTTRQNSEEREGENELSISYNSTDRLMSPVKNPIYQSYSDIAVTDDQLSDES